MTIVLAAILVASTFAVVWRVRARPREALATLIVAMPLIAFLPGNAPRWYAQVRRDHNRDADTARAVAPLAIQPYRNQPLELLALAVVSPGETYAVVPGGRWVGPNRRLRAGPLTYLESWLQFQLAPRLQVEAPDAQWLVLLDGAGKPLPPTVAATYPVGDDVLVRR